MHLFRKKYQEFNEIMSTPASPSSPSGPGSSDPEPSQDLLDTEAPTQMEETQEIDTEAATQIDTEAPTQIPAEMDTTEEGLEETQVDTEAPTQLILLCGDCGEFKIVTLDSIVSIVTFPLTEIILQVFKQSIFSLRKFICHERHYL